MKELLLFSSLHRCDSALHSPSTCNLAGYPDLNNHTRPTTAKEKEKVRRRNKTRSLSEKATFLMRLVVVINIVWIV